MAKQVRKRSKAQGQKQTSQITTEVILDEGDHTLTDEEVDQLKQFKVKEGSVVWMQVGITGAGKSCLGNFILEQDSIFSESVIMAISETDEAALKCSSFGNENLCVIDTPGLGDTENIGSFESGSEDVAYDYSKLATELTKVMMMMGQGINAFLIVVPGNSREYRGLQALLEFFDIMGDYWNHSILVVTQGKQLGKTEKEQYEIYDKVLHHRKVAAPLKNVWNKVSHRLVIVESKDWRDQPEYHRRVVGKIMKYSKEITEQHGPFKDDLQSIGQEAHEKAKLEQLTKFDAIDSPEAQAAIFQSTFEHVRKTVHKLVRIKMADGEDIDKLREMAELKREDLQEVHKLCNIVQKEYQEEKQKRKEAEESLKDAKVAIVEADANTKLAQYQTQKAEEETKRVAKEKLEAERETKRVEKEVKRAEKEKWAAEEKVWRIEIEAKEKTKKVEEAKLAAEQAKEKAEKEKGEAEQAKEKAEKEKGEAEQEKERAERKKGEAEQEKERAERKKWEAEQVTERKKWEAEQEKERAQQKIRIIQNEKKQIEKDKRIVDDENQVMKDWVETQTGKSVLGRLGNVIRPSKGPKPGSNN